MRKMVPLAGGGTPTLVWALSAALAMSTGNSLVTQHSVMPLPPALRWIAFSGAS